MDQQNFTNLLFIGAIMLVFYFHFENQLDQLKQELIGSGLIQERKEQFYPPTVPALSNSWMKVIPTREELQAKIDKNAFYVPIETPQEKNCYPKDVGLNTYDILQVEPYDPFPRYHTAG